MARRTRGDSHLALERSVMNVRSGSWGTRGGCSLGGHAGVCNAPVNWRLAAPGGRGGVFRYYDESKQHRRVCARERERESVAGVCRRRDEGEIWHVFSGGERGWAEPRVCVCKPSMGKRRHPGTRLNKYKVVLANPSHRIMTSGVRVRKNKEKGTDRGGEQMGRCERWTAETGGCSSDLV